MSGFKNQYQPYVHMERMLSESTTFQTQVGAANATEALDYIKFVSAQDFSRATQSENNFPPPRAVIWSQGTSKTRTTSGAGFSTEPRLIVMMEFIIPDGVDENHDAEFRHIGPVFEAIEDEVAALTAEPGNLQFKEISWVQVPLPSERRSTKGVRIWGGDIEFVCQG